MVLGGCRSFLLLVTTCFLYSRVKNASLALYTIYNDAMSMKV